MDLDNCLKKVNLFKNIPEEKINKLIHSSTIVNFSKNETIIKEGDLADSLYVIITGSVQVVTQSFENDQIILARLDEGSCFGEQGYLNNFIRSASVVSLTNVELLCIHYDLLNRIFNKSALFRENLEKIILDRNFENLKSQSEEIYLALNNIFKPNIKEQKNSLINKISSFIFRNDGTKIINYKKNEIIFRKNDSFDYVYLILSGSVILFFDDEATENYCIINKNHLFGELSVLRHQYRKATAQALTDLSLVAISEKQFLNAFKKNSKLQSFLLSLSNTYTLPKHHTIINQYIGKYNNADAIFSIYQLPKEKTALCAKIISQPIFTISISGEVPDTILKFNSGEFIQRTLMIKDNFLVGIIAAGQWDELNILCEILLTQVKLENISHELFNKSGNLLLLSSNSKFYKEDILCRCMHVSYSAVEIQIKKGLKTLNQIANATGACTVCGGCQTKMLSALGQSPWFYAKIQLLKIYSDTICSFRITPIYKKFSTFVPGQFITLKLQINSLWIERSYTLISYSKQNDAYEIMIKKFPSGIVSNWLFEHKDQQQFIWISHPTGFFQLKNEHKKMLCFAGGVGITPFIDFIRELEHDHSSCTLYLVYCVSNESSITFPQDVIEYLNNAKSVQLEIWNADTQGKIDPKTIENKVLTFKPRDIYICGSETFEKTIHEQLNRMNFSKNHIFSEKFVPAG